MSNQRGYYRTSHSPLCFSSAPHLLLSPARRLGTNYWPWKAFLMFDKSIGFSVRILNLYYHLLSLLLPLPILLCTLSSLYVVWKRLKCTSNKMFAYSRWFQEARSMGQAGCVLNWSAWCTLGTMGGIHWAERQTVEQRQLSEFTSLIHWFYFIISYKNVRFVWMILAWCVMLLDIWGLINTEIWWPLCP